jgi:hypothetical protein
VCLPHPFICYLGAVATTPAGTLALDPVGSEPRPIADWVTTFHLVVVVLDPYTHQSSWIIDTAGRILRAFSEADCRVGWLVTASEAQTADFLGPWAEEMLAFTDPDREMVKGLGLESLPAFVHLDQSLTVVGAADGWDPDVGRCGAYGLADAMSWTRPAIPSPGDPTPYIGTPALG